MRARIPTAVLLALVAACGLQGGSGRRQAAKQDLAPRDRIPIADVCAIAQHPERFEGRRLRLRAIVVLDIESARLTAPACMARGWDGYVGIDPRRGWEHSGIQTAIMEARRRSTASRTLAAEGEFEGIVHARPFPAPLNDVGPMPASVAILEVANVDQVRLVALPALQPPDAFATPG